MIVKSGQNLLDVAIQECGDVRAAFRIALENGLSLTDIPFTGMEIKIPEHGFKNKGIARLFSETKRGIATTDEISRSLNDYLLKNTNPTVL